MPLHTPAYLAFLGTTVLAYWILRSHRWRKWLLFASSYAFYSAFDLRFAGLLLGLATADYLLAREMAGSHRPRWLMWASVGVNLGVLAVFKYMDFFIGSAGTFLGLLGFDFRPTTLGLVLPVGVSFYTFQALAYTAEVYRGRLRASTSWLDVVLYLGFFPKLIAGPIAKPASFLDQLQKATDRPGKEETGRALGLLLLGLFKKVVVADSLGTLCDVAFRAAARESSAQFPAPLYWQGFYLYAIQIYADFSGYTDIARASAALFGFDLPENFARPYGAATPAEFWNRWHMTLTQWFREYLFFPLGRWLLRLTGRRIPRVVQAATTMATMTLIGLWHGATWTFVLWGAWHGFLLVAERLSGWRPKKRISQLLSAVVTFHLVGIGWVLFRAGSLAVAARFLDGMLDLTGVRWVGEFLPAVLLSGALISVADCLRREGPLRPTGPRQGWSQVFAVAAIVVLGALAILQMLRGDDVRPFIYGRF